MRTGPRLLIATILVLSLCWILGKAIVDEDEPKRKVAQCTIGFSIDPMPNGQSGDPFDVGQIRLRMWKEHDKR